MAMDKLVPPPQPANDEKKQAPVPAERRLPTPQQFYQKLVKRDDIRAILSRLAKN